MVPILYTLLVSEFLLELICSLELDVVSIKNRLGLYSPRAEWRAIFEMLSQRALHEL